MTDLHTAKDALGYADWSLLPLQGDASTRRFARIAHRSGDSAILMQTPQDLAASQSAFERMTAYLLDADLCAPNIRAHDHRGGILILEDLGECDVATAISHGEDEAKIYTALADLLVRLSQLSGPLDLPQLTPDIASNMLEPYFTHYAPQTPAHTRTAIETAISTQFSRMDSPITLSLRDFHSENLIWRPDRHGTDRLGLVDFQDAFRAPAEYDLASLLWDARRDVPGNIRATVFARFAQGTSRDLATIISNAHLIALQRNLRILGIFARLAQQDGKKSYLELIPRVRGHVANAMTHPSLAMFRQLLDPVLDPSST